MVLTFLGALGASLILTGLAIPFLRKERFMDVPNHRSSHILPVPRLGGAVVVVSVVGGTALTAKADVRLWTILGAMVVLALVGLLDDLWSLPSSGRLAAQLVVAIAVAAGLFSVSAVSWWWLPVVVVAIAGYVNAYNFMDGINGISSLTASVVGIWWAWAGLEHESKLLHILGVVLVGATLGFLPWNAPRARIFLGDVGSYGIGVFVVSLSALALTDGVPWQWAAAPLAVYGADTGWVLVKRSLAGRSLTEAHREHVYQRLVDGGWSHLASACLCAGTGGFVCAVIAAGGERLVWWSVAAVILALLGYLSAPAVRLCSKESASRSA